jgi:predicted PurR-regulated permease PerM
VPYLGAIGIPAAVGLLLLDQIDAPPEARLAWWGILLWPTLVFAIVQIIEAYALTPLIAGKATHLDPVTILVAVLAGGSVLGVYGMLLAIPLAACGRIIVTEILLPRIRAWTRGEVADPLPIDGAPPGGR